jgi:hypothetical protein
MSAWADTVSLVNADVLRAFGESVTYTPKAEDSEPLTLTVIWSDSNLPQGVKATAWVRESDLAAPAQGDTITRDSVVYRIAELPVLESGGWTLMLRLPRQS